MITPYQNFADDHSSFNAKAFYLGIAGKYSFVPYSSDENTEHSTDMLAEEGL